MKRRVVLVDEAIDLPFRMSQQAHGGRPEPRLHKLAATRRGFAIQEGLHFKHSDTVPVRPPVTLVSEPNRAKIISLSVHICKVPLCLFPAGTAGCLVTL